MIRIRSMIHSFVILAVTTLTASSASLFAQVENAAPQGLSYYLSLGGVPEELELVESQANDVDDLWLEVRDEIRNLQRNYQTALRRATTEEDQQAAKESRDRALKRCLESEEKRLNDVLLPHQLKRLREIRNQFLYDSQTGLDSLADVLELDSKQVDEIRQLMNEWSAEVKRLTRESSSKRQSESPAMNDRLRELKENYRRKVLQKLTREQANKLETSLGRRFIFQTKESAPENQDDESVRSGG